MLPGLYNLTCHSKALVLYVYIYMMRAYKGGALEYMGSSNVSE